MNELEQWLNDPLDTDLARKAQVIHEVIAKVFPQAEYVYIADKDWGQRIEFFNSKDRQSVIRELEFVCDEHWQALADESAKNN